LAKNVCHPEPFGVAQESGTEESIQRTITKIISKSKTIVLVISPFDGFLVSLPSSSSGQACPRACPELVEGLCIKSGEGESIGERQVLIILGYIQ